MFICVMCASPVNKRLEEPNMLHPFISASNIHGTRLRQEGGARSRVIYILKMSDPTLCRSLCLLMLVIALMAAPPLGSTQAHDEPYIVKPTPILRATGADDLTTVLLVNNDGGGRLGDSHGRFLSVRPEVGLLTSTARTFIQEGVTTEYATQVVGTTLNNGRLYAQYLKKSSRVLFENGQMSPSVVTSWVGEGVSQTSSYLQSHNDLLDAESPDWREIDDRLDHQFVGNTDYIKLGHARQLMEASAASAFASTEPEKIVEVQLVANFGRTDDNARKVAAHKVLPIGDLPTFTVKNHFEPSAYQTIEGKLKSQSDGELSAQIEEGRSAKVYYQDLMQDRKNDKTSLNSQSNLQAERAPPNVTTSVPSTVTYYGFAEFTTLVGDSLIVFLPSTAQPSSIVGHVTSIKGMATLRTSEIQPQVVSTENLLASKTADIKTSSTTINPWAVFVDATETKSTESSISPTTSELMSEIGQFSTATPTLDLTANEKVIESSDVKPMFSLPTDQEILEIYASLAKAQAAASPSPSPSFVSVSVETVKQTQLPSVQPDETLLPSVQPDESSLQVHGGATTIFIDDDPFANFVEPTSVLTIQSMAATATADIIAKTTATLEEKDTTSYTSTDESEEEVSTTTSSEAEENPTTHRSQPTEDTTDPAPPPPSPTPIIREISGPDEGKCAQIKSQVFLTQIPKTNTILSTQVVQGQAHIPFDIKETTKYYCIEATQVIESPQLERPTQTSVVPDSSTSLPITTVAPVQEEPTTVETQTEGVVTVKEESSTEAEMEPETETAEAVIDDDYVTESDNTHLIDNDNDNEDYDNDSGSDEVDLIYKTLYTTYTYLTTFFQGPSTTVSSHTEVVTNVVTSTLDADKDLNTKSTDIVDNEISATQTQNVDAQNTATAKTIPSKYMIPDELESLLYASANDEPFSRDSNQQTSYLDDTKYTKTFFTTYTYYTTIFAESETEIMSRTEVFTNYITELGVPKKSIPNDTGILASTTSPAISLSVSETTFSSANLVSKQLNLNNEEEDGEKHVTLVTDVRSSSSNGEQQVIGGKIGADDQVSSESNTEEILPSATLLLQTSFTTFTFYTTMYVSDSTNVVSRLETVTNIATETLQPTKVLSHEEATLPITYFTTFTYWTKLAKDGEITTISREETISNVIEPSNRVALGSDSSSNSISDSSSISQTSVGSDKAISTSETDVSELTTFYTTYTYYTTSYKANKTVTDSRFETITNVVTPKSDPIATSALNIEPTTPISIASSLSEITETQDSKKNDLIFYDYKHIIDAEGVSTLYFTTQIQSTVDAEGKAIEVTSSTSSLSIDEEKKMNMATALASEGTTDQSSASARQYKTGLVRLIEGTRIGNSTTTLYQSKVIGTIIDSRYAQIIESTSSFIFEKTITAASVVPSATVEEMMISSTQSVSLLQSVSLVEGSIDGEGVTEDPNQEEEHDSEDADNARLAFQSKKRTFAPVIRPFASRNRPTFAPKHKTLSPSSATIITRSDITPTITATPALKSVGRYSSSRRGAISNVPNNPLDNGPASSTSSRRLFGRPTKPSTGSGVSQSAGSIQQASPGFAPSRNRFASSSRAAPISSSRRVSINASYRPSSSPNFRTSALNVANSKQRIKPTSLNGQSMASTLAVKQGSSDGIDADEESSTEEQTQANEEDEKAAQNSRRSQNPLLRFRRPLNRPSGFTPATRPNASPATISPRRNPLSGRAKSTTTTTTTTTTARPRPRSFQRPTISSLQARARPQSNLFPPRGLFQQQKEPVPVDNSETNDADNESEYDDDEDGEQADGDGDDVENEARRRRSSKTKPTILSRKRRQADTLNRSRFRFRRPKTVTTEEPIPEELPETSQSPARAKINSRFGSRYQAKQSSTNAPPTTSHRSIRPTRPTSPRTQFTLREKDTTSKSISRPGGSSSNFRRQQQPAIRRNPTVSSSASSNSRRLKNYSNHNNNNNAESSGLRASSNSRSRNGNANAATRGRGTMRGRNRNEYSLETPPPELGSVTITVTHLIPAEVTVPVVNGQVTEYKNIVTAKTSIEVLGPHQYTQSLGNNGQTSLFLTREDSSVNAAGATELTRYLLQDSLTSTVTFTPTTIRGRKTSFSHVLPSTVYSVENVVSTLQPQIAANAPLANILLSQLLLGNINLPSNPLLGALGQPQALGLGTGTGSAVVEPSLPVTEYRTHTSTYVTTIYDGKSTIVPITFQGKKILTTVFDTTAQTITATEYSVDTIINTPSPQTQQQQLQPSGQVAQVNSLLLQQLLLQQQQQQQQLQLQLPAQIMQTTSPQILLSENLQDLEEGTRFDADDNIDDIIKPAIGHDDHHVHSGKSRKKPRKSNKGHKRNKQQLPRGGSGEEEESSVVTLYVSGRRPGYNKRHVKHYTTHSTKSESTDTMSRLQNIRMLPDTNHLLVGVNFDDMSDSSLDEARFNLATHVMSNGVELIIASDKVKHVDTVHGFDTVSSSRQVQLKPVTLAPSTLKNHMILALPTSRQENFTIPTDENQFITKTCLTTYTYHTTYLNKGSTTVESREKVVSNRHTEERNFLRASTQLPLGVTLSNTLELAVGIFPTTYHYYNTLKGNDLVITSSYTVINTVTGPEDYISYLQPSEDATPMLDTNTYYTPLVITKTIQDGSESTKVVTDENILTQIVVTESIPARGAARLHPSIYALSDNKFDPTSSIDVQIYATKTYLTTVSYLATATHPSSKEENDNLSSFQTKVIVNVMTDIVPGSLLGPELLSKFSTELMQKKAKNNRKVLVTLATLLSGETLQVTAVNMLKDGLTAMSVSQVQGFVDKSSSASPDNIRQKTKLAIKTSTIQSNIRIEKTKNQSELDLQHDSDTEDQNPSESENNDIYLRPPSSPTVEQLIGSLNLQRFRPVFDVMAELLQKKIVNKPTQAKPNSINVNDRKNQTNNIISSQSQLDEKPVYIPLKPANSQAERSPSPNTLASFNSDINSSNNKLEINLSRLAAHSLHINPPEAETELDFPDALVDNIWKNNNINNNITPKPNLLLGYQNLLLNNGIPIRPGEIINANADVIIGRPNGIGAQFSASHVDESASAYREKTAINYNVPPFKKKTWVPPPPQIPLSLTPPRLHPLVHERPKINRNQQRVIGDGYSNILRPPAQVSQIYPEFSTTSSIYHFQSPPASHNRFPALYNNPIASNNGNGIYGSQQVIINLNSELNNNEILEIKQIPQIFSTQLASVTTYSMSETNYYRQMPPKISIAPTYSAHHHINLKTDVLSHNVNMNVPPLTFKRENENFPLATAVRGHIPPPNMPLIKIPLNKAHVEVRLTPQNNRLAVEPLDPPEPDRIAGPNIKQTASAFKQRNQNFSKNIESLSKHDKNTSYSSKTISSKKPLNSVFSNPKILASSPQFNSAITNKLANHTSKWNISETRIMWNDPFTSGATDSDQAATNLISSEIKKRPNLVYLRPTLVGEAPINVIDKSSEDQSAEYTTYNSKYNLSNETLSPTADTQSPNVNPNFLGSKPEISLQSSSSKNIAPAKSTVNSWLSLHTPYSNQSVRSKNIASDKSTVDPWLSVHTPDSSQSLRLDKPFVKHKPPTQSKVKSDIPKMIFVAHGERFNLRPIATSQIIENSDLYAGKPTKIYPKFGATSLMPLRLATYLKTTTSTRIYGSQTVVGLQPPPTPPPPSPTRAKETSNRYSTPSTIRHMKSTEIVSHSFQTQFNSGIKVITPSPESPIIKNSVRFEDNRTQDLSIWPKSSSISRSNVPESSNVSASNTIRKSSIKKSSTDSKLISILSRKPLLVPTSTHYSNENIRNTSGYLTYNNSQSSLHLLESSEAAPATERQIPIVEIYSNGIPKADKDQITDMLDDATLTKRQNVIFKSIEPSSTTMKKITLTSKTSPALMDEAKLIQRVTKSRTTDSIQAKSRPYTTIMPTTTTMKMQPDISSILVVMTKATGNQSSNSIDSEVPLDYDSSISFEIPARDEEILPPINANSVLLGGILIATPSKTQYTQYTNLNSSDACNPACKSNKNEICTNISEYVNRCKCRLGFARMFPDRPCKPTYTYEMQIPITRVGNYLLKFSDEFLNNSSSQYRHLSSIILDAIDRMVMQSDFRDVYYGIQSKEIYSNRDGAVLGCFLLQLSENSNEKRLETVFKKYLRQSNYSIGGTELYTSKEDINMLSIEDFDECAHDEFNDCSTHAHCFNLVGSYTCSCLDGYVDTSDNSIYPGRQCSDHIVGCDKCNYHGNCVTPTLNRTPVCECFAWHAGAMCQLNLKILLISLIAIGTVFIVLLVCVLLIYTRRRVRVGSTSRPIFITASNYHPSMLTTSSNKSGMSSATLIRKCGSMEKHVILNDSNSESSHNSGPYSFKESNLCAADTVEPEQSDRSLTVMIPRAKYYHPTVLPLKQHELTLEKVDKTILFKGTPHFYDGKLKGTAADASEPFGKEYTAQNSGALVSAGFEVSAIVSDRAVQSSQTVEWKENGNDQTHQKISRANLEAILNSGEDIHRMSSWMSNIPTNTISADLRSFDETTVQAVTKSMHLCFDKVEQSITNEEANTMTERDLGSTFLLPHTHLYKPEKLESDLSGFDSL